MYCTIDDITAVMQADLLTELVNDENDPDADVTDEDDLCYTRVAAGIGRAEAEIDAYLRARYVLPLASVPGLIKDVSVDLAIYHLYMRRHRAEMPVSITDNYKFRIKTLQDVQAGKISLGVETTGENDNTGWMRTNKSEGDRMFGAGELEKY